MQSGWSAARPRHDNYSVWIGYPQNCQYTCGTTGGTCGVRRSGSSTHSLFPIGIRFVLRMTLWSLADISHHYIFVFVKVYWQIWIKIYWDYYYYYCWVFCVWWSNLSSGCGVARGVCVRRVHTLTCHWVTSRPLSRAGLSWSGLAPCPPHPHTTHNVSWP